MAYMGDRAASKLLFARLLAVQQGSGKGRLGNRNSVADEDSPRTQEPASNPFRCDHRKGWKPVPSPFFCRNQKRLDWPGEIRPDLVYSGELKDALGTNIYHDHSYPNFIALPLLEGCTFALTIVAFIAFTARTELWQEWKHLWREVIAVDSSQDDWRDLSPNRHGISRPITPREWLGKVRSKLGNWTNRSIGKPTLEKVAIPTALQSQSLSSPANVQPADSRTKLSLKLHSQAEPKSPVQSQSIFPGARRVNGAPQEPVAWDESQWID
jgi:hypothetical protein